MKTRLLALTALLAFSMVLTACGNDSTTSATPTTNSPAATTVSGTPVTDPNARKIVVASKDFTEAIVIGEMYALVLEDAGIPIDRKMNLGSTDVVQEALLRGGSNGGVDLYPEYTGTGLQAVLKQDAIADAQGTYDAVKKGYADKFQLTWLDRSPMNDTQAMVTSKEVSARKGIKSLQDLCDKAGDLTIAARAEFKDRKDALPALQKLYGGCNFKEIKVVESGDLLYKALIDEQVDAAQADSTAGQISGNGLVLLEDPKGYGGPYNMAPVVRNDVLTKYPNIAEVLNKLSPKITTEEITALNWSIAGQGKEAKDAAKEWLQKQGLIK
ncbi:MAG TPA: glycine betaine ABC transporter substrate-binding protein [Chloroflexia bacterium]|nr:glycine betaine ABC transporter substrate-binding protein [Chloroflexia bacterium]